jgi:hypothetical protein
VAVIDRSAFQRTFLRPGGHPAGIGQLEEPGLSTRLPRAVEVNIQRIESQPRKPPDTRCAA